MNFAFSSMPNDMHAAAEGRQARLERELKCMSRQRPVESKLGFSHLSIFSQSAERAARAAPNGVKKGATFLLLFRSLNHTDSSRKPFNGVQKGQVHSKKHKPSKKYFCGRSTHRSPPAGLQMLTLPILGSAEALPILCVRCARRERERYRERERERETERERE